jgi:hypothetical protein
VVIVPVIKPGLIEELVGLPGGTDEGGTRIPLEFVDQSDVGMMEDVEEGMPRELEGPGIIAVPDEEEKLTLGDDEDEGIAKVGEANVNG